MAGGDCVARAPSAHLELGDDVREEAVVGGSGIWSALPYGSVRLAPPTGNAGGQAELTWADTLQWPFAL